MKRMVSGSTLSLALDGCECNDAQRAAGAIGDLERCGDNHCTGCRQLVQIDQARDAEFACAVHRTVVRKRRIEGSGLPSVRSNGLYADAQDVAFVRQELGAFLRERWRVG